MRSSKNLLLPTLIICFLGCSSDDASTVADPLNEDGTEDNIDMEDPSPVENTLYFPPLDSDDWETISITELGWSSSAEVDLLEFLEEKNTKAFIILKDGKIAVEAYFNGTDASDNNPWYSAGKTLTAFTAGMVQQEGYLNLNDPSSDYLGNSWSSLSLEEENAIEVVHHLSMTTGLDYTSGDVQCTDPDCLFYLNEAGSFWYYHNAAYTLVQDILSGALEDDFDSYFNTKLRDAIGMNGAWVQLGYARVYFSNARSMARFGLLNLNEGSWEDQQILTDGAFFNAMTNTSQEMNPSYGYLWWLNGKQSYRLPASEAEIPGKLVPSAPDDLVAGLGKDDQKLYVVPSMGLVIVRMGDSAGELLAGPSGFDNELWQKINELVN